MNNLKTINERINEFFIRNYIPKFVKHRDIALLDETDESEISGGINLIPMKKSNPEIIEIFKKNHFNIIIGNDEHLKRISPLEVFFIHRTDMIIALDSDDFAMQHMYRSAFNSPVFSMDTRCGKLNYFIDARMNYRACERKILKRYENFENLFVPAECEHNLFMIIDAGNNKKSDVLTGLPLLSLNKIIEFQTNSLSKIAVSKDVLSNQLNKNIRGALNFSLRRENGILKVCAMQYAKNSESIHPAVKKFIKNFMLSKNIKDEDMELEFQTIW